MKELSIFVDESGDFGEYDYHAPYYIISMVLHDQSVDIADDLRILENELTNIGWPHHCVHAGPVIRSEEEYRGYDLKDRQKILMKMMTFIRFSQIMMWSRSITTMDRWKSHEFFLQYSTHCWTTLNFAG